MKRTSLFKLLTTALIFALALVAVSLAQGTAGPRSYLGQPMPDFTVTTIEGETLTLSEVLAGKKAVLVNLWATWCGPCAMEFPSLEQAYETYKDDVEVIALSIEANDTDDILKIGRASCRERV